MNRTARTLLLLGGGALAFMVCPEASAGMPLVTGMTGALASGLTGQAGANIATSSFDVIHGRLTSLNGRYALPENHDLARALRCAQLDAVAFVCDSYRAAAIADHAEYNEAAARAYTKSTLKWVKQQRKLTTQRNFIIQLDFAEALHDFDAKAMVLSPDDDMMLNSASNSVGLLDATFQLAHDETLNELTIESGTVPQAFVDFFIGKFGPAAFAIAAKDYFVEAVKTDTRLFRALSLNRFDNLDASSARMSASIQALGERFTKVEALIKSLQDGGKTLSRTTRNTYLSETASENFETILNRLVALESPSDGWAASRASHDVFERQKTLLFRQAAGNQSARPFHGRKDDIDRLDDRIDQCDRSLSLICGRAGAGKSALMANWVNHRRQLGDLVVRHFITEGQDSTASPVNALRHILAQLREIDAADPNERRHALPNLEHVLLDKLTARLSQGIDSDLFPNRKLILVIDGLDELNTNFQDVFIRSNLGAEVHIVLSARAGNSETPLYLRPWTEAQLPKGLQVRFDLEPLKTEDIMLWLENIIGHLDIIQMQKIADAIENTSEGLPLFISFLMDDIRDDLSHKSPDLLVEDLQNLPSPFYQYIMESLSNGLKNEGQEVVRSVQFLFSVLCRVHGPISNADLSSLNELVRNKRLEHPSYIDFPYLPTAARRWLSIRAQMLWDGRIENQLTFQHPQLGLEFAKGLETRDLESAQRGLEIWMNASWTRTDDGLSAQPASVYALRFLPLHLTENHKLDEAMELLMRDDFIDERIHGLGTSAGCLQMSQDWKILTPFL